MLALTSILPTLLFIAEASALHPNFDRSRLRSIRRRHHARRAQADCNGNRIQVGGTPIIAGRDLADLGHNLLAVAANSTNPADTPSFSNVTTVNLPGTQNLLATGSADTAIIQEAVDDVVEVVIGAVEDVITASILKSLDTDTGAVSSSSSTTGNSEKMGENGLEVPQIQPIYAGDSIPYVAGPSVASSPSPSSGGTANSLNANMYNAAPAAAGSSATVVCEHGAWKCDGMTLKRESDRRHRRRGIVRLTGTGCNWNQWVVMNTCSGANIVCSYVSLDGLYTGFGG